ncbi:MAG: SAM-dependent methyltransferase [Actinobacteria bacterium]|nr:MAG: SAM-dependent methyltransferase [Actinomycetota bacterium]
MKCGYYEAGACRSCTLIDTPYSLQLEQRVNTARDLLATVNTAENMTWLPPQTSPERGFRVKAKMAVGGSADNPTLGLLDPAWKGVDLSECPILAPELRHAMPRLRTFIAQLHLTPYDVRLRRGELKYVIVTASHTGDLMVRFILRSRRYLTLLTQSLPLLRQVLPNARVITANIHPIHAAVLEGPEEIVLTEQTTLPMEVGDIVLHAGPRSFTQTNTVVAGALYRQVGQWANLPLGPSERPSSVWDLYCGIGGFALHASHLGIPHAIGVEISDTAIASAQHTATTMSLDGTRFVASDAISWAVQHEVTQAPNVVVVNPPRRGLGPELTSWLDSCTASRVIYSSCNPKSLARDLRALPSLRVCEGRLFDMFPHTQHAEVAVLCERV